MMPRPRDVVLVDLVEMVEMVLWFWWYTIALVVRARLQVRVEHLVLLGLMVQAERVQELGLLLRVVLVYRDM
jgi:hypothetical protein